MKLNGSINILTALILLPSFLLAQESEFVEDRSNSVVEFVDSDQKTRESTEAVVKDNDVKKPDIVDSLNAMRLVFGAHLGGLYALPLDRTTADEVREKMLSDKGQENTQEVDASWKGAKASVGAALGFYFNRKMALITGLDYQMLYYKTTSPVPRNRKRTYRGPHYRVLDGVSYIIDEEADETDVRVTSPQDRSLTYHHISAPVSFRYYFLDDVWGQVGIGLDWVLKGKNVYEHSDVEINLVVRGNLGVMVLRKTEEIEYPPTELPVKKEIIPSLLLSAGKSWTLGKWNIDAALSLSYALRTIDLDYGLSARTFAIGFDIYAWYSLTKEKK